MIWLRTVCEGWTSWELTMALEKIKWDEMIQNEM